MRILQRCFKRWGAVVGIARIYRTSMINKSLPAKPLLRYRAKSPRAPAAAVAAIATIIACAGCSSKNEANPATPSVKASNVTLTADQRRNIQIYTVEASTFHKTIDTTAAVDFDNDQATSVLAPFSGPVSRLLVSLGEKVKKGAPLAEVDSPDFATAISAYRKALITAQTLRRLADLDKDLIRHQGVSQREQ